MIIDAHVHLPVGDNCISLQQKKERLLYDMSINQVNQCIVISDSSLTSSIGTLKECVELFMYTENVYVVGGISPFFEFGTQLNKLKEYLDKKMVVGIKLFTGHEAFYLTDKRLGEVYDLAIGYNIPVLFHSGWDNRQYADVEQVAETAGKYPELKLICCHCFYPEMEKCRLLMDFENLFFDVSSIADDVDKRQDMLEVLKKIVKDAPDRVLFGSDYSCCNQKEHIEFIRELKLEKNLEDNIFWKNARRIYRLE